LKRKKGALKSLRRGKGESIKGKDRLQEKKKKRAASFCGRGWREKA